MELTASQKVQRTPSYRNRSANRAALKSSNYDEYRLTNLKMLCQRRAKKSGIAFDLTFRYLKLVLAEQNGVCALSGLEFERTGTPGTPCPRSMSIDRIRPELGYVQGNIRLILVCLNSMRYNGTDEQMFEVIRAVYRSLTSDVL